MPGLTRAVCFAALFVAVLPGFAWAEVPSPAARLRPPIVVFGEVGYAYPVGTAEQGTDTRDVSFGIVPLSLAGAYELGPRWSAGARLRYAPNVPTLCASASDCFASVGWDLAATVLVSRALPRWRCISPHLGLEVGWEWLTTKLSDSGVSSSRTWNGPTGTLELFLDLRSEGPWMVGPVAAVTAGVFTHASLSTPASQTSGSTAAALHAWPTISFRVGRQL
jgi:hypothetical protein